MKQYALILLSTALALSGCGDSEPAASAPATEASSDNPASGVWIQDEQVLVLESNGDFYLPNDAMKQGLSWEQDSDQFTFRYLDSSALSVEQRIVTGQQQDNTLTLEPRTATPMAEESTNDEGAEGSTSPAPLFAGEFQRDYSKVGYLDGQAQLPQGVDLPEQAMLTVILQADDGVVVRRVIPLETPGTAYPFRLYYPTHAVDTDKTYQISSQILAGGGIFYQSEITELTRTDKGFSDITLPLDPVMNNSETLRGAMVWQHTNPVLVLCNSDQRLQISGPQGNALVEEVRDDMRYPQQPRIATVSGVRRKIPGEQEGTTQAAVAVESYNLDALDTFEDCQIPSAQLTNTRWVLTHLGEQAMDTDANGAVPHLALNDGQARGNGGCNSFQGSYQEQETTLRFNSLASTEMACPALKTEQAFHQALDNSDHYRIDGELLTLFNSEDQPVASFQAVYL